MVYPFPMVYCPFSTLYSNFGDPKAPAKPYAELVDRELLQKVMKEYLEDYNPLSTHLVNLPYQQNLVNLLYNTPCQLTLSTTL